MQDVFSDRWQIEHDIEVLKTKCRSNIRHIDSVVINDSEAIIPIAINYNEKCDVQLEVDNILGNSTYLYVDSDAEITAFLSDKAIGSVDFNHDKINLSLHASGSASIRLNVQRHWQESVRHIRTHKENYRTPGIYEILVYELDEENYALALFLEQIFLHLSKYNEQEFQYLRRDMLSINFSESKELIFQKIKDIVVNYSQTLNEKISGKSVLFLGNSHLDILFKWHEGATIDKNERTFSNFYSNYLFDPSKKTILSQMYLLKYVEEYSPYQVNQIKEMISAGALQIVSPLMTEFDSNLMHPSSLYMNAISGREVESRYSDELSSICFLPDTFGFSNNITKVIKDQDMDSFVTTKLKWNDTNKFEHNYFTWSESINSCYTYRGYGGNVTFDELLELSDNFKSNNLIYIYGEGDGGGGPNIDDYLLIDMFEEYLPGLHISKDDISDYIRNKSDHIIDGEIYLEKHRGVYTTGNRIKRMIRESEISLNNYMFHNNSEYDLKLINDHVDFINFISFHDTASGTMVHKAYEDVYCKYDKLNKFAVEVEKSVSKYTLSSFNITPSSSLKMYNDRSGYFDSWDINTDFKLYNTECIYSRFDLSAFENKYGDFQIDYDISKVTENKIYKLSIFENLDIDEIYCDTGFGVEIRKINHGCVSNAQFEFPHLYFVAFQVEDKFVGVINQNKYGTSLINGELELSILKTGTFPNSESEVLPEKGSVYITVGDSIGDIRKKANEYNNKISLIINEHLSIESLIFEQGKNYAIVVNSNIDKEQMVRLKNSDIRIGPNDSVKVLFEELNV